MSTHGFFHISLAAKCRLLFGLAVALIIGSALFIPWRILEKLVRVHDMDRARWAAQVARAWIDPSNPDWGLQQALLDQYWRDNVSEDFKAAQPRLVPLPASGTLGQVRPVIPRPLQAPLSWSTRTIGFMVLHTPTGETEWLIPVSWHLMPKKVQDRIETLAIRTVRFGNPFLDKTQRQAAAEFLADERLQGFKGPVDERADGATVHRYLLPIRSLDARTRRQVLIGMIDVKLPTPETNQGVLVARLVIGLAGGLAGFLAILVFYLITQKLILAPVRDLKTLVEQVANGDLTARSHIDTGDEFAELSVAFNDMLERLERARAELEKINRSLDARLGELAETNVALYESNRLKSEFLANVSHELRTPLTSIIGFADLMRDAAQDDHPLDKSRIARYAHNILTSGRMLLDIINDLLDLAKIEAGRVDLHRTTFSLRDLCEALGDFLRPMVDKKAQTLTIELDDELPLMSSDAGKIRQVLYNLLSNANKYTPDGGAIRLEARRMAEDRIRLVIEDNGPGIAPEDQERIFEKFRQLDSSVTREHSGTGLGLAISRELCTMLGGTIRLESEVGQGARFIVELPIEAPENSHRPLPSLS